MKIYNTLNKRKEEFRPLQPGRVNMYVCGPTVYNYFHIGNARPLIFFDVVRNYLQYSGYNVTLVRNITDIDDKLIEQSIREDLPVKQIAAKYIAAFYEDCQALEIAPADHHPHATEYIGEMINLIKRLEEKEMAYAENGDVYFAVNRASGYGKLSGKKLEDLQAGARVEANQQKRHAADFTLWKKAKPGEPQWASPWGKGRPGWHTECVVMSEKYLGDTFDIHGGGIDLVFPHHENELAQAEALNHKPLANYWMHNGYLNIEGKKMSKSLNNFFTARDILQKYSPEAIRFFFLSKHYRSPIDFNEQIINESEQAVKTLYSALETADYLAFRSEKPNYSAAQTLLKKEFEAAMDDDFNTAKAISSLYKIAKKHLPNSADHKNWAHLLIELGSVLGFFQNIEQKLQKNLNGTSEQLIELLLKYRRQAKQDKNWQLADAIRNDLKAIGIELKDSPSGTDWKIL
ncbi:MAG: cysteine--tRNA ligase [Candidatus Cloacimonadales bacterium]